MTDQAKWQIARLDDIERRGRSIPVREHLGIHAFGVNGWRTGEDGVLINDHTEGPAGQEELYVVLDGQATFEIDGETVEAPAGTLLYVSPEARRKATGDATILAFGGIPGEAYRGLDWGEAWPFHSESMTAYGEQRYADALQAVRGGLEQHAGPPGPSLQLRVLLDAGRRDRRRDVPAPRAFDRIVPAVPRAGAGG